jgi:hypothetical protein
MDDKLKTLYDNLVKDNYDLPAYDIFKTDMSDNIKSQTLHETLLKDNYDVPDYDTFANDLGLKKKVASEYVYPTSKAFTGVASAITGNIPKDEPTTPQEIGPLEVPQDTLVKVPDISKEPAPTEEEKDSYASDLFERIGAGAMDIATSGPKQMTFAQRIIDIPRKILKKELSILGISDDKAESISQSIPFLKPRAIGDAVNISSAVWNKISKTEGFENIEKKADDLRQSSARYDKTIEELLKAKEYKKVVGASFLSAAESFPLTITAMFGGPVGLAAIGMYSASAQYDQVAPNTEMNEFQKMSNALLNGGLEIATERIGTANYGKLIKGLYTNVGKEAAEEAVKKGLKSWLVNMFKKVGIYTAPIGEGLEEAVNQFGSNVTARMTGEDPNRPLDLNVITAATSGIASGTVFTTVGLPGQIRQQIAQKTKAKATTDTGTTPTEIGALEVPTAVAAQKAEEVAFEEAMKPEAPQEDTAKKKAVDESLSALEEAVNTPAKEEVKAPEEVKTEPVVEKTPVVTPEPAKTEKDWATIKGDAIRRADKIGLNESELPSSKIQNDIVTDIFGKNDINVSFNDNADTHGNNAKSDGTKITIPNNAGIDMITHEIGHILDGELGRSKQQGVDSKDVSQSVTTYGASDGGEAFAENVKLFFLSPNTLKELSPKVYSELEKIIPQKYKDIMEEFKDRHSKKIT